MFYLSGTSGTVRYTDLSVGTHVLLLEGRASNREREVVRRRFFIGMVDCLMLVCLFFCILDLLEKDIDTVSPYSRNGR